ncbi:MAG: hypothetical protein ABSF71_04300 [Terriglobia bacterium]|jgi:hypothetical protein
MEKDDSEAKTTVIVGDMTIPTVIRFLPVPELRYYAENPRIFSILRELGKVTQDEIERKLWEQDHTKDLFRDIKQNGGLLEEIIVRGNEVLEGNSRLCAYRRLLKDATATGDKDAIAKWSVMRARILPPDTNEKVVFAILGTLHIRGKAEWKPYEQASYLFRQATTHGMTSAQLAAQIGTNDADVKNMIEAYKLMDKHKVTDLSRFSYFVEFAKSKKLEDTKQYLPPNLVLEEKFSQWVKDGKIPRAEEVRNLPTILRDKSARTKFLSDSVTFEEALETAREHHPEATSSFYSKLKKATEAMNDAEEDRIRQEVSQDAQKKHVVRDLAKTARKFAHSVGADG